MSSYRKLLIGENRIKSGKTLKGICSELPVAVATGGRHQRTPATLRTRAMSTTTGMPTTTVLPMRITFRSDSTINMSDKVSSFEQKSVQVDGRRT